VDKLDRIFQLHAILSGRRTPIARDVLMTRLECSRPTLFRTLAQLRDYLGAPIEFDPDRDGYFYKTGAGEDAYELPGLWFSSVELQCLAVMQQQLVILGGGLLAEQLTAFSKRLGELIADRRLNLSEAASRLRFPTVAARPPGDAFQVAASATLQRKQLAFTYHSRGSNRRSERSVSPQRLVHYRDAWYLDAWDDASNELRTFSMERVRDPRVLNARARDIPEAELNEHFTSGYGIFGGKADKTAVLRFTAERARWIAEEEWHPSQTGSFLPDGTFELRIPYRISTELVMDILRHGPHVEVVEPAALRQELQTLLEQALGRYRT
jgi:proteasome accessory factor C